MRKKADIFYLLVLLFSLTTCTKDHMFDCFKSTGETVTESRDVSAFSDIELDDNVDLIIHPNSAPYIKVTAGENLIDGIITELSGNKLYIRNENRCNWVRSFKNKFQVEIGIDQPQHIVYYGSGDITCIDSIKTPEFYFDCTNGSGSINFLLNNKKSEIRNHTGRIDIHLKGNSESAILFVNDVATLDATELSLETAHVRNSSTGDMKVNVISELSVEILYNGNIYYSGNPVITSTNITGTGKLIQIR